MQIHTKTGMLGTVGEIEVLSGIVKHTSDISQKESVDSQVKATLMQEKKEPEFITQQKIMDYYYLKYQYDHVFVIGDNKLKLNVEVMTGKQTLYCSFHDTRNAEHECEHIRFVSMLDEIQN
jgi:hypothetical protein